MPINDDELLAAVTESVTPTEPTTPENSEDTAIEAEAGAEGEAPTDGDAEAAGESAPAEKAEGEAVEKGEAAEGKESDKAKPADDKKSEAEKAEQPKQKDPVNDPIPPQLKKETRERMESLITTVKALSSERDQAVSQRDEVIGMIQETKATPQQFGDALTYLKLVNSGDPVQQRKALQIMQQELAAMAQILGEPVAGVDLLGAHPDLKQAVENAEITPEHAQELVALRAARDLRAKGAEANNREVEASQALQRGRDELNALEAQLRADPAYAAKKAILVETLKPVFANIPPAQWAATFKRAYEKLPNPVVAAPVKPAPKPVAQPLRAQNPAGGQQRAVSSILDAVNLGISQAAGR